MIDQTTLVNFIQVIVGFSVLGAIVDLLTAKRRSALAFTETKASYRRVLQLFYDGVFERLFPGKATSKKFVLRTIFIGSALFLCFFVVLGKLFGVNFQNILEGYAFQFPLFVGFLFIFWVSLAQTKLFVRESIKTENRLSRFVFIFADLLTSSNIFIFLFSLSALLAANVFAFTTLNGVSSRTENVLRMSVDKRHSAVAAEKFQSENGFRFFVEVTNYVKGERAQSPNFSSRYLIHTSLPYLDSKYFVRELTREAISQEKILFETEIPVPNVGELETLVSERDEVNYSIDYYLVPQRYSFPLRQYSNAYLTVDILEDQFWGLFSMSTYVTPVENFLNLIGGFTPFDSEALCVAKGWGVIVSEDSLYAKECRDDVQIVSGRRVTDWNHLHANVAPSASFLVPLSPYYLASMTFSFIFYFGVLSVYFFKLVGNITSKFYWTREIYAMGPFTLSGVFLGLIVWALLVA